MALSRHHGTITQPYSVAEIVSIAQDFEFSTNRPLRGWLRSAQMLLTEAAHCEQDDNLQMSYLYLLRHAELVLGKFPQHPDFKDPANKAAIVQAQNTVQQNLAKLEQLKPRIKQDHERYVQAKERRNAERQRIQAERLSDERQRLAQDPLRRDSTESEDGAFEGHGQSLNVNNNRQLAVDLAHREIRRRDATRQTTRQAGLSPSLVAARRRGVVMDTDADRDSYGEDNGTSTEGVREAGRHLQSRDDQTSRQPVSHHRNASSTTFHYPTVPTKEGPINWQMPPSPAKQQSTLPIRPPSVPAKEALQNRYSQQSSTLPPVPPKAKDSGKSTPSTATPSPPPTTFQLPSKPTFKPTAFTESGAPLRPVLLPPELRSTFLNLAHKNTARNLETCGILCGTLISNALFINHLIVPDQQSTSDTCDTTEEGDNDLFDYCDANDLLVCGWIHTHPSQTCFLSSRDLHTSSGYQVMLPEAIAIVCAPRQNPDWGIFRLTDPPGLKHVLDCQQRGLFHPHSETNLYTDAVAPGHVVEGPGLKFEVVDLRRR